MGREEKIDYFNYYLCDSAWDFVIKEDVWGEDWHL